MFQLVFLFVLISLTNQIDINYYTKCDLSYEWKEICFSYKFSDTCLPWDLRFCLDYEISQNEYYCPIWDCSVSLYFCIHIYYYWIDMQIEI